MSKTRTRATKMQIKNIKKELNDTDDDSSNNEHAVNGANINKDWTDQESLQLIDLVRKQTETLDALTCCRRIKVLNWNDIKIPNKAIDKCSDHLEKLIKHIPRYRTLGEVLTICKIQRFGNKSLETADPILSANNMTEEGSNETVKRKNAEDEKNSKRVKTTPEQKPSESDTNGIEITADTKKLKKRKGPIVQASKKSEANGIGMTAEKVDANKLKESKGQIMQAGGEGEVLEIENKPKQQKRQEKIRIKKEIAESDSDENGPTVQKPNGKKKVPAKRKVNKVSHEDESNEIKPKSKKVTNQLKKGQGRQGLNL